MKILITGATGLIGTEIMRQCSVQKIPVHYLTTAAHKIKNTPLVKGFLWNPKAGVMDYKALDGVTHIINLAGWSIANRWTKSNKAKILNSRLESLKTLFSGVSETKNHSVEYFLGASAIGIYPSSKTVTYTVEGKEKPQGAKTPPSFLRTTVLAWEAVNLNMEKLGIKTGQLRVGLVLDAKQGALPQFVAPVKAFVGAAFGTGKQWQSWIHVHDIAALFLKLCKTQSVGVFNGVAPEPITQNQLVKAIATHFKKPLLLPNLPLFVMRLILGEMVALVSDSQKVAAKKAAALGFIFKFPNIKSALEDLYPKA